MAQQRDEKATKKFGPMHFIMGFGIVSMLMDIVYEAALSVQGPLLYSVGATAAVVGIVSGIGEATSLAGRLVSGPAADRTGRYWTFAILGYAATGLAVPAMGFVGSVFGVSFLIVLAGVGTFGVMSYHMVATGLIATPAIPVIYAIAMAVDGVFALLTGALYDKIGTKALLALPVASALIPFFVYTDNAAFVVFGVILWGASLGIQESTMRAAVADMVPGCKRATSYGLFSVFIGVGALVGASATGMLYAYGQSAIVSYTMALETAALIALAITLYLAKR